MINPAVTDDGPAPRAVPRLWSPCEATPDLDTSPEPKPPLKRTARKKPATTEPVTTQTTGDPQRAERYSPTIRELPSTERPRERLFSNGPDALSTAELLGILIRIGNAQRSAVSLGEQLLAHFGNVKEVACASATALAKVHGIGEAKAAQIKAAIEFGRRVSLFSDEPGPLIGAPGDVSQLLMSELRYIKKETLKSLLLNTKNRVLAIKTVSIGDLSSSIIHPREVFQDAIVASAASIILAHNHPSGDPAPSPEDIAVTKRIMEAGKILGIELLDHIIIGDGTFVSLKERGKM